MSLSGIQFKMHYRIISKIEKAGATSMEKAVTIEEAGLDKQEEEWLNYFLGASLFFGRVMRTEDERYYV